MELMVFGAGWCELSKLQNERVVKTIAKGYDVSYTYYDIDDPSTAMLRERLSVRTVPTTLMVEDGAMADRIVGLMEEFQIDNLFYDILGVKL